jgi:hypothetical protein
VGAPHPAGYSRDEFGQGWADVDHNGCDQRNDVLRRDTKKCHTKPGTNGCVLQSGVIKNDRYSYASRSVKCKRGSSKVEIDHVVSLADAWRMGAYDWSTKKREKFANDLMNLEANRAAAARRSGPVLAGLRGAAHQAAALPPRGALVIPHPTEWLEPLQSCFVDSRGISRGTQFSVQ